MKVQMDDYVRDPVFRVFEKVLPVRYKGLKVTKDHVAVCLDGCMSYIRIPLKETVCEELSKIRKSKRKGEHRFNFKLPLEEIETRHLIEGGRVVVFIEGVPVEIRGSLTAEIVVRKSIEVGEKDYIEGFNFPVMVYPKDKKYFLDDELPVFPGASYWVDYYYFDEF